MCWRMVKDESRFAAPRARLGESGTTFVDPLQTAIFELDISNKPGAIRNKVSTAIPIIATVAGQSIRDVAVELDPGSDPDPGCAGAKGLLGDILDGGGGQ